MIFPAICLFKTLHFPANFTPKPKLHFSERSPATPNPTTLEFPGPKTVVASQSRRVATTRESQNRRILETIRVGFTSSVSEAVACPRWPCLHSNRYKRDHWLGQLTQGYNLIAVSGSHGKSTTASMLAYVLDAMGDNLTAVVGAHMPQFSGGNIILGDSQNFVLEADEYDGCFLGLSPYIAVVTNLDWEHVDIFQNEEAVKATFHKFLNQAYSLLTDVKQAIGSDTLSGLMHSPLEKCCIGYIITTYGTTSSNEWSASSIRPNLKGGSDYTLCHWGRSVADISLRVPGVHNVLNSLAVIATVIALYNNQREINHTINGLRLHLNNFIGVSRRFEMIGTICGCDIYDDYAHHPMEVQAVIQAAHQKFPIKSLLVVFQPHTYSRLAALKDDFASALCGADQVVVTEVYAAREIDVGNVGGRELAASVIGPPCEYIPSLGDVVEVGISNMQEPSS